MIGLRILVDFFNILVILVCFLLKLVDLVVINKLCLKRIFWNVRIMKGEKNIFFWINLVN